MLSVALGNMDVSRCAYRSRVLRARSVGDVAVGVSDYAQVLVTVSGFLPSPAAEGLGSSARYVGLGSSRVRDGSQDVLTFDGFRGGCGQVAAVLVGSSAQGGASGVVGRYAAPGFRRWIRFGSMCCLMWIRACWVGSGLSLGMCWSYRIWLWGSNL